MGRMKKLYSNLIDLVPGKNFRGNKEVDCNIEIMVDSELWHCYSASVCIRDLLLYCEEGTATYVIDWYGDDPRVELYDWEKDE